MFHSKYIILLGEDYPQLVLLQHQIHNMGGAVTTAISNIEEITALLQRQLPDLIILYLTDGGAAYTSYINRIRQNPLADEVPMVVCREPLDLSSLQGILR